MRPGIAGSVQVVSSTNGELGPANDDTHLVDRRIGIPLNSQPEVEIVDETKYETISFLLSIISIILYFSFPFIFICFVNNLIVPYKLFIYFDF